VAITKVIHHKSRIAIANQGILSVKPDTTNKAFVKGDKNK